MECKTAQLLLPFLRPGGHDLAVADRTDLESHVETCPHCGPAARAEARFDTLVGQAMRAVQPPVEFRHRLLRALAAERQRAWRRFALRGAGVAALVALALVGVWQWNEYHKPVIDAAVLVSEDEALRNGTDEERIQRIEDHFRNQGTPVVAPKFFNYRTLKGYERAELLDRFVPSISFQANNALAVVYVVSDRQFKIDKLQDADQASSGCVVHIRRVPGRPNLVYVIKIWNGTLDDFKNPNGVIAMV